MFIGNLFASREIRRWLIQSAEQKGKLGYGSVCIVIGPVGCGKTHGVLKTCEQLGRVVHMIDSQNSENFKDTKDKIVKLVSANITDQFRVTQKVHNVIIMDEIETLISLDRSYLHSLQKMLESGTFPHIPIILTVQSSERKKILEMFGKGTVIEIHPPNDADMFLFLRRVRPELSVQSLDDICTHSAGNLSVALKMLDTDTASEKASMHLDKISTLADVYVHAKPSMARYVFLEDPWLHPLRFHENLGNEIAERSGTKAKKQQVYLSLMRGICIWDSMMSHFKGAELHIPIEYMSQLVGILGTLPRKKTAHAPMDEFTKMFSHMSLEKKNQIAMYDNGFHEMGSYYKSILDQMEKKKKTRKVF